MEKGMTLQIAYRYGHGTNMGKIMQSYSPFIPQFLTREGR